MREGFEAEVSFLYMLLPDWSHPSTTPPPPPWLFEPAAPARSPAEPRGADHLLDVFSTLVVDEDDDGVDVHVVQPLNGVGGDVQETVPILRGIKSECQGQAWGSGPSGDTSYLSLSPMGPTLTSHYSILLHKRTHKVLPMNGKARPSFMITRDKLWGMLP